MTPRVSVGIPWRATPERLAVFRWVWNWWEETLHDADIFHIDTDHQPFNLNAARNAVVRDAEEAGSDIVVICDADVVLSNVDSLHEAIQYAWETGSLTKPHGVQRYLTGPETAALMTGQIAHDDGSLDTERHGDGAIYIVQPKQWWEMGGADERFIGWGGDDFQIVMAADTFIGIKWFTGNALTLWHADECRPIGSPAQQRNARLSDTYGRLRWQRKEMRKLIESRPGGWEGSGGYE